MKIWHRIPNLRPRESPRTNFQCCPRGFEISSGNYSAPFGRIQILTPESESVTPRKLPYKFSILLRWVEISSANYSAPWGASKIWDRIGIYTLENAPHQIWSGYKVFCENMVVSVVLGRHRVIACVDKHWRECQTNWCNKPSVRVGVVEILIATVVKVWGKHGHQGLRISISVFSVKNFKERKWLWFGAKWSATAGEWIKVVTDYLIICFSGRCRFLGKWGERSWHQRSRHLHLYGVDIRQLAADSSWGQDDTDWG